MKILIVDDHMNNNYMLESLFKGYGYEVITALNGKEALIKLQTEKVDLIFSDVLMPVMDGFTLCREIRKDEKLKHIPFIFYTATYTGTKDEEFAEKIGANAFLIKPAEPRDIIDTLERVIEQSKDESFEISATAEYEQEVQKLYSERLVRKLEQKMLETEQEALARKQAMKLLQRNERLLRATQRVSNLGGWEWEVACKKMYWTDQVYLIFDLDLNKYKGIEDRKMYELIMLCYNETDRKKIKSSFVNCHINAIPYSIEGWITTAKGNKKYICTVGSPITEKGKVTNVYGYFQDLTNRKYAEMKEHELNEQLSQAQKLITIGQLAGGVAHDFNNILTVIMGNAEIALSQISPDNPIKADIEEIMKAGKRASNLTKQLLSFSRKQIVKPEPILLNHILEDMTKMIRRLINENIEIELNCEEDLAFIKSDVVQMEQVILNLAINAGEAMPKGGKLTISLKNYIPDSAFYKEHPDIRPSKYVLLTISDTGIGMDEATQKSLFEPFFTTKSNQNGTGLGLVTVYRIIQSTSGYIKVKSAPGKGTTFLILIPATEEIPEVIPIEAPKPKVAGHLETVLVVEDDEAIRFLTSKAVTKLGYKVLTSVSGDDALIKIRHQELTPDLIISNVIMPGLNGIAFVSEIKKYLPGVQIILMSGYSDNFLSQYGTITPDIYFLAKPFTRSELEEAIRKQLSLDT